MNFEIHHIPYIVLAQYYDIEDMVHKYANSVTTNRQPITDIDSDILKTFVQTLPFLSWLVLLYMRLLKRGHPQVNRATT